MGYYVTTTDCTFTIPEANLAAAYERLCALNARDDLKRGGKLPADPVDAAERAALGYNPNRWFSWMDDNYPAICADAEAILKMLGFDTQYEDGDLRILHYDNKTGQEELFLAAISDLATGYIVWRGEEGESWRETYGKPAVWVEPAVLTFGDGRPRTLADFPTY